ncbi:MAG: DNA repair protein RecO [Oscillospiraceae bacterium]|nr:DNA repair protein RecO [Oscillospiraceae bacterium]
MPELITQKGLVLHETAYGETDKIINILTDTGVRTVRVRGARKPQSKYAAVTQAFSYCEFCMQSTRGRLYLDSAAPISLFYPLRTDLTALALAAYFAELVRLAATDQHQPEILRLFLICLHYLSEKLRTPAQIKAAFELRLLTEIGLMPDLICCAECCAYLPEHPVLRIDKADMICAECSETIGDEHVVTRETLLAARHAVFSEMDKVLAFRVSGRSLRLFAQYAEQYVLHHLEQRVPALRYYKDIASEDT